MRLHEIDTTFNNKRTFSMVPKLSSQQPKTSNNTKQNDMSQIPSTMKYITQNEKQPQQLDETEKFLTETKNKLELSSKQLQEFHKKRLMYRSNKQDLDYSILSKEIKATKQKLRNKNQQQKTMPVNMNQTHSIFVASQTLKQDQKLNLLEKALSPQQLQQFQQQLTQKQQSITKQYRYQPKLLQKLLQYHVNYQIISRFLEEVAKDAQKLEIKKENILLYYKMKEQMVSLLSNEEFFVNHIKQIEDSEEKRDKGMPNKVNEGQQRFAKVFSRGKQAGMTGQKSLVDKIEELLETSKNSIKQAFSNFNRPYLMQEIELQFNKRLNQVNTQ